MRIISKLSSNSFTNSFKTFQYLPRGLNHAHFQFEQLRFYSNSSSSDESDEEFNNKSKNSSKKLWELITSISSKDFNNYSNGFERVVIAISGLIAIYTGYKSNKSGNQKIQEADQRLKESEKEKGKYQAAYEATRKIGLVSVQSYGSRSPEQQANQFLETKERLTVIGMSGLRLLEDKVQIAPNPVANAIKHLLANKVEVRLMIYSPDLFSSSKQPKHERRIQKIKSAIELAKKLKEQFPDYFDFRLLQKQPPFHGDLIDNFKAHIIPITLDGIDSLPSAKVENYERNNEEIGKIFNIKTDMKILWESAEESKNKPFI